MRIAIVVGAGATLAEALPRRPSNATRPPLDKTFFKLCRDANLTGRAAVRSYMVPNYGIDPFAEGHRMEEIFNFIYSDAFSQKPPDGCLEAYWSLMRMYSDAIAKTTNPLSGNSSRGVGALLRFLWRTLDQPEITFVTFNQDLVIEKSIENAVGTTKRYSDIPWNVKRAYAMRFGSHLHVGYNPRPFKDTGDRSIGILKLHGSLNWVYRVRSGRDPKNSIRSPRGKLVCLNEQTIYRDLKYRTGKYTVDVLPLFVPPIYEKVARYQQTVAPIWHKAFRAVSEATTLIVFGYSFPETDISARSLLRRSFYSSKCLNSVIVLDTDPNMAARAARLLCGACVHYYPGVEEFARNPLQLAE